MKVLLCHTHYQVSGGEDQSFLAAAALLERRGHEVLRFVRDNGEIERMGRLAIASRTIWNHGMYRELRGIIRRARPDVVHCTNLFLLISPSAYYAARAERVPVVQSLQNYRLSCLNSFLFRDGAVCEDCLGRRLAWPGVQRGCYRDSRAGSAIAASMLGLHRAAGTWPRMVDVYFTLSEFAKRKLLETGVPEDKLLVKPNFIYPDPGMGEGDGGFAVFVGRLSPEKGLNELLAAWRLVGPTLPLRIIGDGPMRTAIEDAAAHRPEIDYVGRLPQDDVLDAMGCASVLVMPSMWHETFGRRIVEAFAKGTAVVASNLGAMAELVDDDQNGLLGEPGDIRALAVAVQRIGWDSWVRNRMRRVARATCERLYTEDRNSQMLMAIYDRARVLGARRFEHASQKIQESA